jgi:hypothetical protein
MVEAARAVHGTTARLSAGAENRMLAEKRTAVVKSGKAVDREFPFKPDPESLRGKTCIHDRYLSALSRQGHLAARYLICQLTVPDRDQHRSTTVHQPHT